MHSSGDKYAPVAVGFEWQLKSVSGNVLCGYRGKHYTFEFEKNANVWLCTNLSRVKNAKHDVSDERLQQIGRIYIETGDAFALQEIHDIWDLNKDIWQPIECENTIMINEITNIDGGNAFTIY